MGNYLVNKSGANAGLKYGTPLRVKCCYRAYKHKHVKRYLKISLLLYLFEKTGS
jgi:hypothetical protein